MQVKLKQNAVIWQDMTSKKFEGESPIFEAIVDNTACFKLTAFGYGLTCNSYDKNSYGGGSIYATINDIEFIDQKSKDEYIEIRKKYLQDQINLLESEYTFKKEDLEKQVKQMQNLCNHPLTNWKYDGHINPTCTLCGLKLSFQKS
jgi:hypothetical protein